MAQGTTKSESTVEGQLEPSDIELRNTTVVLSVRLDDGTARLLHRLAQRGGVRISDVLREAAVAYAAAEATEGSVRVAIMGGNETYPVEVTLGRRSVSTEDPYRQRTGSGTLPWAGQQAQIVRT